jgi:hypothetical protein
VVVEYKLEEQPGSIAFPPWPVTSNPADLVLSLFHHPYNWMTPDSGRAFREYVETTSDILLSGHEHVPTQYQKHGEDQTCKYLEGGVLNDSHNPQQSEFSATVIDLTNKKFKNSIFAWHNERYEPKKGYAVEEQNFLRNVQRLKNQFLLTDEFKKGLCDLGTEFTHRAKSSIYLNDVFVRPSLKVLNAEQADENAIQKTILPDGLYEFVRTTSEILILGEQDSGKTCLGKHLFQVFRDGNSVPIILDGQSLTNRHLKRDKFLKLLEQRFEEIYANSEWNTYLQLDREKRVLILDDFDKCDLNEAGKAELLGSIEAEFGRVVLFADPIFRYGEFLSTSGESSSLLKFSQAEIMPLGNRQKQDLIKKWLLLGRETTYAQSDLIRDLDHIERLIKTIMTKELSGP